MKLPAVTPLEENYLCTNRDEFAELLRRTIENSGGGAFFKVLGKVEGVPYYATILIDNQKILAVEVQNVKSGETLVGEPALQVMRQMIEGGPTIVDAFPLDDVNVKMSVVDNLEVYNSTPKMHLSELCPVFLEGPSTKGAMPEISKLEDVSSATTTSTIVEKPKPKPKPKVEFVLEVPPQLEPYFRVFGNHLIKYAKSLGVEPRLLKVTAKEVRYALGAGTGIHATVELEGSSSSSLSTSRLRETMESFVYREAAELSEELGKKVVVSRFILRA